MKILTYFKLQIFYFHLLMSLLLKLDIKIELYLHLWIFTFLYELIILSLDEFTDVSMKNFFQYTPV